MNLTTLHVLPDLDPSPDVRARVCEQVSQEVGQGATVHALARAEFGREVGRGVNVHVLDPELTPAAVDSEAATGALNALAVLRALDLEAVKVDVVVAHGRESLLAANLIATRREAPLVLLEHVGEGSCSLVVEELRGQDDPAGAWALDRYRRLLGASPAAPGVDVVVLAENDAWSWIEPLLLHFPSLRIVKRAGLRASRELLRARVLVLVAERPDAPELVRAGLDAGALPILIGEGAPALAPFQERGAFVRATAQSVPEEVARWLHQEQERVDRVASARAALPPVETAPTPLDLATQPVSVGVSTVRVAPRARPLRVVLNHGGLVAQELAENCAVFGWEVRPLLGEGRDPLPGADFLIVLPYGDPRGALEAVRRAKRLWVPTAFWNVEDPRYYFDSELGPVVRELAREASVTFSTTAQLGLEYRALGVDVTYLPIYGRGFFEQPEPVPEADRTIDLLFLGTLTPDRWRFLDELRIGLGPSVSFATRDDVRDPDAMRSEVARARLGLSFGTLTDTPEARGAGVTERVFDYPLAGTPVLSDERTHLAELFVPGEEVFVYRDLAQALELVPALLADPARRMRAASQARRKVLAAHLGRHRVLEIARTLLERGALPAGGFVPEALARATEIVRRDAETAGKRSGA